MIRIDTLPRGKRERCISIFAQGLFLTHASICNIPYFPIWQLLSNSISTPAPVSSARYKYNPWRYMDLCYLSKCVSRLACLPVFRAAVSRKHTRGAAVYAALPMALHVCYWVGWKSNWARNTTRRVLVAYPQVIGRWKAATWFSVGLCCIPLPVRGSAIITQEAIFDRPIIGIWSRLWRMRTCASWLEQCCLIIRSLKSHATVKWKGERSTHRANNMIEAARALLMIGLGKSRDNLEDMSIIKSWLFIFRLHSRSSSQVCLQNLSRI